MSEYLRPRDLMAEALDEQYAKILENRCPIIDTCLIKDKPQAWNCRRKGRCFSQELSGEKTK